MLNIPSSLRTQFEAYLQEKPIPKNNQAAYHKWLRYYLDFWIFVGSIIFRKHNAGVSLTCS